MCRGDEASLLVEEDDERDTLARGELRVCPARRIAQDGEGEFNRTREANQLLVGYFFFRLNAYPEESHRSVPVFVLQFFERAQFVFTRLTPCRSEGDHHDAAVHVRQVIRLAVRP